MALVPTLRRGHDESRSLTRAVSELHRLGVDVDWQSFFDEPAAPRTDRPTYALRRKRLWVAGAFPGSPAGTGTRSQNAPARNLEAEPGGWPPAGAGAGTGAGARARGNPARALVAEPGGWAADAAGPYEALSGAAPLPPRATRQPGTELRAEAARPGRTPRPEAARSPVPARADAAGRASGAGQGPASGCAEAAGPGTLPARAGAAGAAGTAGAVAARTGGAGAGVVAGRGPGGGGTLAWLLRGAHAQGRTAEGAALLMAAAELLPRYEHRAGVEHWPAPAELAPHREGIAGLFAFPSLGAGSGPHEYGALAAALDGRMGPDGPPPPRLRGRSRTPAHPPGPRTGAGGSGGAGLAGPGARAAGALLRRLDRARRRPGAARTGPRGGGGGAARHVRAHRGPPRPGRADGAAAGPGRPLGVPDDGRLLAMGGHLRVFADWTPEPAAAPTLLVRAARSAARGTGGWEYADHVTETPGDHFSLLGADSAAVAAAVDAWLHRLPR